ncbi:MAG: hemolysin family protein [Gammaproteobacteria bacterium SHHR-1]|uniref:CNNM domain-containing protein n=1 Tax=Magnetovirga frankeli TaxID=947516 RepID=UPI001293FD66|nr:HlyC/CorC family transporter [gamma proteobacterium SS-5]
MTLLFFYLFLALFVSFLCSILESVLLSSTSSYIQTLVKESNTRGSLLAKELKTHIDRPISAILILNTFAHTMGAAGVGAQTQILFGDEWQTLMAIILTLLILYFTEIIPKTIGATYWKRLLIPAIYTIHYLIKLTYPLILVSIQVTRLLSKGKPRPNHSRNEILAMVEMSEREGSILSQEGALIENLLRLKEHKARDIMTPRSVMFALSQDVTVAEALVQDGTYIHSRIPVYKETQDSIIGLVFNQRILQKSIEDQQHRRMEEIAVPVFHVSENLPVNTLLDLFVKRREHQFIVHDSYGQTVGLVTMEDAIETLLGVEIIDEMDQVVDMQSLARERSRIFQERIRRDLHNAREAKAAQTEQDAAPADDLATTAKPNHHSAS